MHEALLAVEILLISAILSVDNALIIGLATRHLAPKVRQQAIFWGTMGAVVLRIGMSLIAVVLIDTPYLKLIGGLFLLYLAFKMLGQQEELADVRSGQGLLAAIQVIVIADVMVSIDNVLAIVGIAKGVWWLLLLGILISIPCILWGSKLIARLLVRYPLLHFAGVAVLSWTGASLIIEDPVVAAFLLPLGIPAFAFHIVSVLATAAAALAARRVA